MKNVATAFSPSSAATPNPRRYQPSWPIAGKPLVKGNFAPDVIVPSGVIWHSATDIYPENPYGDRTVTAPVAGRAKIFYDNPRQDPESQMHPYHRGVAIQDADSGVVAFLLHIKPRADLSARGGTDGFFQVERNEPIGEIADSRVQIKGRGSETLRHVHFVSLTFRNGTPEYLDTLQYLPSTSETDPHPPTIADIYLRSPEGPIRHLPGHRLRTDLVAEVYDETRGGGRIAPRSIEGEAHAWCGGVWLKIWDLRPAHLASLLSASDEEVVAGHVMRAYDLKAMIAATQDHDAEISAFDPLRTFPIVATNLMLSADGATSTQPDSHGVLDIPAGATVVSGHVKVHDAAGNATSKAFSFERPPAQIGEAEPSVSDAVCSHPAG